MTRREAAVCAHCGRLRTCPARGLCGSCLQGCNGCDPLDYERSYWSSQELVAEWHLLASQGYSRRAAAERLGIDQKRLEKAIERQSRKQRTVA